MAIRNNLNWHFIPDQFYRQREKEKDGEFRNSFLILEIKTGKTVHEGQVSLRRTYMLTLHDMRSRPLSQFMSILKAPQTLTPNLWLLREIIWFQLRGGRKSPPSGPQERCGGYGRVHNEYLITYNRGWPWVPVAKCVCDVRHRGRVGMGWVLSQIEQA